MKQTYHYFEAVAEKRGWSDKTNLILTGHSQGGNDAQICTMNTKSKYAQYIDACYSYDGQGHSPEAV